VTSRTGPRRSESARLAVLNAADDILVERGFAGVTIEAIAARAGVAKQTIYRWWKSKVDILLDTLADDALEALEWKTGAATPEEDLRNHLHQVAEFFQEPAGQVLQALLGQAQLDKEAARKFREGFLQEQHERDLAGLGEILRRHVGHEMGEQATAYLVDLLMGPLYYQILVFGRPVEKDLIPITARLVLDVAAQGQAG